MLAAEAVRLVAIELLRPSDIPEGGNFPTLAGSRVFDSRGPTLTEIDQKQKYTPVLSVYTQKSSADAAGAASGFDDTEATVSMLVMAELAVVAREGGTDYVDAMTAGTDVEARLVLAALVAQVRRRLEFSAAGEPWRKLVKQVLRVDEETHAVPEFGLRWQRIFCTFNLAIGDDDFDMSRSGLPEPLGSVAAALPDGSYAKQKLAELAACFAAENPDQLNTIHGATAGPGGISLETGQDDLSP